MYANKNEIKLYIYTFIYVLYMCAVYIKYINKYGLKLVHFINSSIDGHNSKFIKLRK